MLCHANDPWRLIMIMSVTSSKSLDELDQDLRKAIQRHKFGVLNMLDLKQTLGNKGIVLERECRVYDICNPQAASTALNTDMSASVVLPCRMSVTSADCYPHRYNRFKALSVSPSLRERGEAT